MPAHDAENRSREKKGTSSSVSPSRFQIKCDAICPCLSSDEKGRYPAIDIFRGVAILTMLSANSAAQSLAAPHPFWLRIYGSFAAAIFVFLAGFMVSAGSRKHDFSHFVKRSAEVLLVATLLDLLVWQVLPWTTFDVLYLIALCFDNYFTGLGLKKFLILYGCFVVAMVAAARGALALKGSRLLQHNHRWIPGQTLADNRVAFYRGELALVALATFDGSRAASARGAAPKIVPASRSDA